MAIHGLMPPPNGPLLLLPVEATMNHRVGPCLPTASHVEHCGAGEIGANGLINNFGGAG
jgi:hypothetical protein